MRQSLVPVLLLASVAFSSSNVLSILPISELKSEPYDLDGQENDNIFSNKFQTRNVLNDIFFKVSDGAQDRNLQNSFQRNYMDTDNNPAEDNAIHRDVNYNGEGFRKEQWHNYPRQLDRLHKYLYEYHNSDKRNLDPDDPANDDIEETKSETDDMSPNDLKANEFHLNDNADIQNIYDAVSASTDPLSILKIRLACLNDVTHINEQPNVIPSELNANYIENDKEEQIFNNELNPAINLMKVKRDSITSLEYGDEIQNPTNEKNAVKKRLFSLWSRLQGLNHRGHELHHRRHLYALYGLPDADGNRVLTAETRATLMRPPGSPLRWG